MKLLMTVGAIVALTTAACQGDNRSRASNQSDLGTGLNTVDRKYAKSPDEVLDAATSAAKAHNLEIESDRRDSLGGELIARRGGGDRVTVKVRGLDAKNSDVSVRVDPGNRNMAEMIHEKIADKLGIKEAKSAFFGGNTAEGTYNSTVEVCLVAAEAACRKLKLTVTHRESDGNVSVVDAREQNSSPVQFRMKKTDDGTKVSFIAGREKTDASKDMAERMKAEFERALNPQGN